MNTRPITALVLALSANLAAAQPWVIGDLPNIPIGPIVIAVPAVPSYEITDLGVLSGESESTAVDINNKGVVVGRSGKRSFSYGSCRLSDLGSLGGSETVVEDIHDSGAIVGWSRNAQGTKRPFLLSSGVMSDIGGQLPGEANAISSWNIAVGTHTALESLPGNGVYYINNEAFSLPRVYTPTSYGYVEGVADMNDKHRVTGFMQFGPERWGVVSAGGFGQWTRIQGVPGFEWSVTPRAINNNGYVVGVSGNGQVRAFLSTNPNTPATDLGLLANGNLAMANDINNDNWIVGWADVINEGFGTPRAVVRAPGGSFVDLNTRIPANSGWFLYEAMAINDAGRIVGNGVINAQPHAFMLTPTTGKLPRLPCVLPPIAVR